MIIGWLLRAGHPLHRTVLTAEALRGCRGAKSGAPWPEISRARELLARSSATDWQNRGSASGPGEMEARGYRDSIRIAAPKLGCSSPRNWDHSSAGVAAWF